MRFSVFGREVIVERRDDGWQAWYPGADGKRRPARDLVIPAALDAAEVQVYLSDLCHEWASPGNADVVRLDGPEGPAKVTIPRPIS